MLEGYFRPAYQRYLVNPLAESLATYTKIKPHIITLISILFGIISSTFIIAGKNNVACLFLLVSGYCDTLDGTLARIKKSSSAQGAVIDIVGDRIVEIAVIFGLFCVEPNSRAYASFWMLASSLICITTFLVVGIFSNNKSEKSFHYSPGLMERPEAFIFFILMIVIPKLFFLLAWIYTALVCFTAVYRMTEFIFITKDVAWKN